MKAYLPYVTEGKRAATKWLHTFLVRLNGVVASKTRKARLSVGSVLAVRDQGKRSLTKLYDTPRPSKRRSCEQDKESEAFRRERTCRT